MEERKNIKGILLAVAAFLMLIMLMASGCATSDVTNPPRAVSEQLLLSTAADRAMTNCDFTVFTNKRVFVDASFFDAYDAKYAVGDIRDALSRSGARLVGDMTNADVVVEARAGGLSIDGSSVLLGVPNMGLPIPMAGALQIPEVALFKSQSQRAIAKFALLAYDFRSREHFYSSGSMVGRAYNKNYKILIVSWNSSDLPEKHPPKKSRHDKKKTSNSFQSPVTGRGAASRTSTTTRH